MPTLHPSPYGHLALPEPDFGRPGGGERVVKPTPKKGGPRGRR